MTCTPSAASALTERHAKDREEIARLVTELTQRYDGKLKIDRGPGSMDIKLILSGGIGVQFQLSWFTKQRISDTYVLIWFMPATSSKRISDTPFGRCAVNPHHRRKATQTVFDVPDLLDAIEKAKQTETFRRDGTSVVVSIEKLKEAME